MTSPAQLAVERVMQANVFLNKAVYDHLTRKETEEFLRLSKHMSQIDSLSSIDEIRELRERISRGDFWYTRNQNVTNCYCYGIWHSLFPFLKYEDAPYAPVVEHGFIEANTITHETRRTARLSCVSFGEYRRQVVVKELGIPTFCVGPYISYADDYYDDDKVEDLRKRNGKTLLFLPGHSVNTASVNRNTDLLIRKLHEEAAGYDTVLICIFWWDSDSPLVDLLQHEGFKIVSAGFLGDGRFLSRLRSLMKISDCVMSDAIGTHAPYAFSLGIPFKLLDIGTSHQGRTPMEFQLAKKSKAAHDSILNLLLSANIDEGSLGALDFYWGLSCIRTVEERQAIAAISRQLVEHCNGFRARARRKGAKELLELYRNEGDVMKARLLGAAMNGESTYENLD